MSATRLATKYVEKPWGRTALPGIFPDGGGRRIGEVWFDGPAGRHPPLLVKYIFTSERLSIQVHPNDAQGRERGLPGGKSECWLILDAEPGATLGMGTLRPLSGAELRETSLDGGIERLMDWKPVTAGDFFYIPAGVPHLPYNPSADEACIAVIARTDPNEQESVVLLPELDALHPGPAAR